MTLIWHDQRATRRDETPQRSHFRRVLSWLLLWVLLAGGGCSRSHLVGLLLADTLRPRPSAEVATGWAEPLLLLAGDLHFHLGSPVPELHNPEADGYRSFEQGVALLRRTGLDFVAITPHLMHNGGATSARRLRTHRYFASIFRELAPPERDAARAAAAGDPGC